MRRERTQAVLTVLTFVVAVVVVLTRAGDAAPLRMNDYRVFGTGQSVWPLSEQMLFVMPVPAFSRPVRIRAVELRTVAGTGTFDHSDAYLLQFQDFDSYNGVKLTTQAGLDAYTGTAENGTQHRALDALRVQKSDNQLSLVIPVNIHSPGCHEAQVILHVSADDGSMHTFPTRWFVTVDTGVSKSKGLNFCAGPLKRTPVTPTPAPTV
jgi:hypothetical protein